MLTAKNLGYEIDGHDVFSNVSFSVSKGDKAGLIGPNGAGKTTLLRMLVGNIEPSEGKIIREDVEVGLLPQDLNSWLDHSVYDFLEEVTGVKAVKESYSKAESAYQKKKDEKTLILFCDAAEKLGHYQVDSFEGRVMKALRSAGLSDDFAPKEIGDLSGGQRTRVALAAIMSAPFDVILLDEPTNNLDMEGIVILEKFIQGSSAAFLMVSHDRRFLRNATSRIIELLGGDSGVNHYGLGYDDYVQARVAAYEADKRRFEEHKLTIKGLEARVKDRKVQANSANSGGSAARRKDNDKLTANFRSGRAAGHLASQAKALESRLEQMKENAPHEPQPPITLDFMFPEADISTGSLLLVNDLTVEYDNGARFGPYNLSVYKGDRIAIVGANGTGKSTLVKAIMGQSRIAGGKSTIGAGSRVAYIDQSQSLPLPELSPIENLLDLVPGLEKSEAMRILKKFNIKSDQLENTKVNKMSGGERAKILLASIAAKKANLLILDEPTNNLDIPTIEGLQEALSTYKGAIVVISHDRDFIEGIKVNQTIKL